MPPFDELKKDLLVEIVKGNVACFKIVFCKAAEKHHKVCTFDSQISILSCLSTISAGLPSRSRNLNCLHCCRRSRYQPGKFNNL